MSTYLASFLLFIVLFSGFIFIVPAHTKRMTLRTLGFPENNFRYYSYSLLYKYSTIFSDQQVGYYQAIGWNEKPDPGNPDSGWGKNICKRVFPLTGDNVEIVPINSIGYEMDRTCDASTWNKNAYSYTDITSLFQGDSITLKSDVFLASVYCYVSKDFNGAWARISAEGGATGKKIHEYDLNKKGTWQKLQINFTTPTGIPPVYLFWSEYGVSDFKQLKGYVIFAYPEYWKKSSEVVIMEYLQKKIQKYNLHRAFNKGTSSNFNNNEISFNSASLIDLTLIRGLLSNINCYLTTDTSRQLQIEKHIMNLEEDKLTGGRLARWYYGWVIFKDYPWYKKIYGGGFDYLELFGKKFGAVKYDYPHNPFISAFLYSGIIGGLAYIWFMILVFWNYIKYWKHHLYFFICFLTIFFFSFVSADTLFSVPVFTIFSLIPFLTKYLVDRKIINDSKDTSDI